MRLPSLDVFRCFGQVLLGQLAATLVAFLCGGGCVVVLLPDLDAAKVDRTRRHELVQLAMAIESYRQREGFRPAKLEDLVTTGVLERLPLDAWERPFRYERTRAGMRPWSLGPDGVPDGEWPASWRPEEAELFIRWVGGVFEPPPSDDVGCRVEDTFTPPDACR